MKVIFSRKGCDLEHGGIASPIFPDGGICPLPRPAEGGRTRFKDLMWNGRSIGPIADALKGDSSLGRGGACLNPDIDPGFLPREAGWRPCFGQHGEAQRHLDDQHIGEGDIFLFFGPFREVLTGGGLRFRSEVPPRHCIYGWLQVGAVHRLGQTPDLDSLPEWALPHPHVRDAASYGPENTLYTATQKLKILGMRRQPNGGGVFRLFQSNLVLSARDAERPGLWMLPHWIYPASRGKPALSCHTHMERWAKAGKGVLLSTVDKCDEFVLNTEFYPEARDWLRSLFDLAELSV